MPKRVINFYSFATKYCSHHNPITYPINDSYVEKILLHWKKVDKFFSFSKIELRDFKTYKNVLVQFQKYYGLKAFDLKEIDGYLWQLGKRHFERSY